MNTFWLKIAGGALVAVLVLIVAAKVMSPGDSRSAAGSDTGSASPLETVTQTKSFTKQVEEDKEKFAIQPPTQPQQPKLPAAAEKVTDSPPVTPPAVSKPRPQTIYVKPLDEIDRMQAERLLSAAVPGRSMGRLQVGYNLTVQNGKQIIQDYPDTWYAYQAKRLLADIPERFRSRYKLTPELLDVSMFAKPRPGTKPMQLPPGN